MHRRPSFLISAIVIIVLLFVLATFLTFLIKIAFLALVLAAAYYLFARATHSLSHRRHRRPRHRDRYE